MGQETYYDVLTLSPRASTEEIKARYTAILREARQKAGSGAVHPSFLVQVREAYITLADPKKRSAYDASIGKPATPQLRDGAVPEKHGLFARAWRGEIAAWKPFWLLVVPAVALVYLLQTKTGLFLILLAAALLPSAVLAIFSVFVLFVLAGAVVLWRCAFNVQWRPFGYAGRACAFLVLALTAMGVYQGFDASSRVVAGASDYSKVPQERRLLVAAQRGDLKEVRRLVDSGADVSVREQERGNKGRTPLHYAAGGKHYKPGGQHTEVIKLLLARGADVNAKAEGGYTPLHVASGLGQVEIVRILLDSGADINARDVRATPLGAAIGQGHEPVVMLLVERKVDLSGSLGTFSSIGQYLPAHTPILKRLIDAGADINEVDRTGQTVFDYLINRGEGPVLLLLTRGANLNAGKVTAAQRANRIAQRGYLQALQFLFDQGYEPRSRGPKGETLMHNGVFSDEKTLEFLLVKGLRLDEQDDAGDQPIHYAVRGNQVKAVSYLLSKGISANTVGANGKTPLMQLGYRSKERDAITSLLLDSGGRLDHGKP